MIDLARIAADDHQELVFAHRCTMLGAYWRWKLFPARRDEFGPNFQEASHALRVAVVQARRAGLSDVALAEALRMTVPAAAEWADVLVRAADRAAGPAQEGARDA